MRLRFGLRDVEVDTGSTLVPPVLIKGVGVDHLTNAVDEPWIVLAACLIHAFVAVKDGEDFGILGATLATRGVRSLGV